MIYHLVADPLLRPLLLSARPPALDCTWDTEAGTLTGQGAAELGAAVDMVVRLGQGRAPHPYIPADSIDAADPLHAPADMALVISSNWRVPEVLAAFMPPAEDWMRENDPDWLY